MARFDKGKYSIYVHKDMPGDSPASPERPVNEVGMRPQSFWHSNVARLSGAAVAASAINVLRQEVGATTGNEELQAHINNTLIGLGLTAAAIAKPVTIIPMALSGGTQEMMRYRNIERQNRMTEYENRMRGRKIGHMQGVYYG